ncbi:MAG: V-type ATP synthase subunit D [Fretibacterium sp.]|nr:V-type ATP synthase subunit D [Fretibacterium sp.]
MTQKLAATRGNMARIRFALNLARQGHDLLERKRKILMSELMARITDAMELQKNILEAFEKAYFGLQLANISLGIDRVENIASAVPEENRFVVRLRSVMGVDIPETDPLEPNRNPSYSFGGALFASSSVLDSAYVDARELVSLLLKQAEMETAIYRLAIQIRKTVRRVNALEKVLIPRSEAQLKYIAATLDENEREDLTRIKLSMRGA